MSYNGIEMTDFCDMGASGYPSHEDNFSDWTQSRKRKHLNNCERVTCSLCDALRLEKAK